MKRPEQIPYGVKDFKHIRLEGRYYVDKTAYIREPVSRADFMFFPDPMLGREMRVCEEVTCC